MSDHLQEVQELLEHAEAVGEGAAQLALLEEAVRLADSYQDDDLSYAARRKLLWPAYDIGRYDVLMVNFSWCLAHSDRHPDKYRFDMLWSYRWVVNGMAGFPEIAREQVEHAMTDMARRYREAGYSLRPVHILQRATYKALGDRPRAAETDAVILACPRDSMSDDRNTERAFRIAYLNFMKDYTHSVYHAEPFLQDLVDDQHFTAMIRSDSLKPLVWLGRIEEARTHQRRAYSYAGRNPRFIGWLSDHIEFLAIAGDFPQAVRLAEKHFPIARNHKSRSSHFYFYKAVLFLLERLLRKPDPQRTTLRVPAELAPDAHPEPWPLDLLRQRLEKETRELATLFDTRNGNQYFAEQLDEHAEWHELADRVAKENRA